MREEWDVDPLQSQDDGVGPLGSRRIPTLDELEGFYIGEGRTVHVTFEDRHTLIIDIFDTEEAAFDSDKGEVVGHPIVVNLRSGDVSLEGCTHDGERYLV